MPMQKQGFKSGPGKRRFLIGVFMSRNSYWRKKGEDLFEKGDYAGALLAFERALSAAPMDARSICGKAKSLMGIGVATASSSYLQESLLWFDKAISIDPMLHEAWYLKASAMERLGLTEEARLCYDRAFLVSEGLRPEEHHEKYRKDEDKTGYEWLLFV